MRRKIVFCGLLCCCLMGCLTFVHAAKQVTVRGIVLNSQSDSIGLYDALGRVKEPLEMAKVDSKGNFKFYFAPAEIGYYMLQCKGGKGALCVLKPESAINITVDARTGMIVNAENSKENQMFHDYQAFLITLEYYKDSLVRAHQETPNPNIQQQMQQLEMRRVQYLGNLCWRQPDNYAAAALLEYMSYEAAPVLFDTVFNTLHRLYPKDLYIQAHYEELRTMRMLAVGAEAPDFTLPDTNGVMVSLKDLRGKVVVIDFWASWCRPCRMENPNMVKLYQKYHEKGLEILGVSLDGDRESWMKAIHQDGLYWTQVSDLKRWNCAAAKQYGVTGIPFTLLLDKDGKIVAKGLRGDDLLKKVESLLGE
ncbi:MAG: TlpA family protein disulfide reductase [Bacteroidales bacterium]|nr:TlpA family protein disulfide reductase [Bacteroidales bacterium]